jgi:hypothetical protein
MKTGATIPSILTWLICAVLDSFVIPIVSTCSQSVAIDCAIRIVVKIMWILKPLAGFKSFCKAGGFCDLLDDQYIRQPLN